MKLTRSTIYLKGLRLRAYIGVLPQEKTVGNLYEVNLEADYPTLLACQTDQVEHTMDYAELLSLVTQALAQPMNLLEHAAAQVAEAIFCRFPQTTEVRIDLRKLAPPLPGQTDGAGVRLTFSND